MEKLEHAWHYTTATGLLSILARNRMWATSAAYMNDSNEIRLGREALMQAIEKHDPPLESWQLEQLSGLGMTAPGDPHSLFLLCASVEGDALTLWRSYGVGSEAEYALDLDPDVELVPVLQNSSPEHPAPAPPGWDERIVYRDDDGDPVEEDDPNMPITWGGEWGEVRYLDANLTDARQELDRVLAHVKPRPEGSRSLPFILNYIAGPDPTVNFKHRAFSDEREARATWAVQPWWRFVLHRPGRFGITPYIEVAAPKEGTDHAYLGIESDQVGRLPIRAVRIGPTKAGPQSEATLRQFLDMSGYHDVQIDVSSAPYR